MIKRNILITTMVSTLLLTSSLSAQMHCSGGKCFVDLKKLLPTQDVESKIHTFKILKKTLTDKVITETPYIETVSIDNTEYIVGEPISEENYNDDTIVLDHSRYIMTDAERENFFENQRLREVELAQINIVEPVIQLEEKIIENVALPKSELFCEVPQTAEFNPELNSYTCG